MKLSKKDHSNLIQFNKIRKRNGEDKMSPDQYLNYLYGKTKLISNNRKYTGIDIPSWAINHDNIPSAKNNHIAVKPNQDLKKEISKQYTVSISYNKGSYSVIPSSEIKCIGKK